MNPELVAQNEARLKRDVVRMAFMTDSWEDFPNHMKFGHRNAEHR